MREVVTNRLPHQAEVGQAGNEDTVEGVVCPVEVVAHPVYSQAFTGGGSSTCNRDQESVRLSENKT